MTRLYTTGYIKTHKHSDLYRLQNYTDANTISLYDRKIVVKEYAIAYLHLTSSSFF